MKKLLLSICAAGMTLSLYGAPDFYFRGYQNKWDPEDCPKFQENNGVYSLHVDMLDSSTLPYGFKICNPGGPEYKVKGETRLDQEMICELPPQDGQNIYLPSGMESLAGATLVFRYNNGDNPTLRIVPDLYLAGEMTGWSNTNRAYRFSDEGNGKYRLSVASLNSGERFRIAAGAVPEWIVEFGGQADMNAGTTYNLIPGSGNDMTVSSTVEDAVITIDRNANTIIITSGNPNDPSGDIDTSDKVFYLTGGFNNWASDQEAYRFTRTEAGIYTLNVGSLQGEFKIVTADWGLQYGSLKPIAFGKNNYCIYSTNGDNMTLAQGSGSDLTLIFDYDNLTLAVEDPSTLYIVGDFNGWTSKPEHAFVYDRDTNEYTACMSDFSGQFRVVSKDWSTVNLGGGPVNLDKTYLVTHNHSDNMQFAGGNGDRGLKITLYPSFEGLPTGIGDIESTETCGAVEYYDMCGARIDGSGSGVMIRRTGDKVEKIIKR